MGDHPRSRGVYFSFSSIVLSSRGSSPLARGLLQLVVDWFSTYRIIPARAGFTPISLSIAYSPTDHPRSRGVYWVGGGRRVGRKGSSPLARGLLAGEFYPCAPDGIIPARAGFTSRAYWASRLRADHPRSRGVYGEAACGEGGGAGSSPLARGLRRGQAARSGRRGIIPARAGFTRGGRCRGRARRDHPRSRGVYLTAFYAYVGLGGSSPLARGLPFSYSQPILTRGIIPARAGFTRQASN